jgi:hypothetical protein
MTVRHGLWKQVAILGTIWVMLTVVTLLVDYVGVRIIRRDDLYGIWMGLAVVVAPVAFGWPFHVRGSRHLLSYRALGVAILLAYTWYWFAIWLELAWFHSAIGGTLHV